MTASDALVERLRAHAASYHSAHPFHVRMNDGTLTPDQIRGWVANRCAYQEAIPVKDAAILSNCPDVAVRRRWIRRITDHDGTAEDGPESGGIEAWLQLGEACGLTRSEISQGVLRRHALLLAPFYFLHANSHASNCIPPLLEQMVLFYEKSDDGLCGYCFCGSLWILDKCCECFRAQVVVQRQGL